MHVHQDSMAVADVAKAYHAEVVYLGTIGPRQRDSAKRIRTRPSQSKPLIFGSEAGPCGSWLSRSLTNKGLVCWVVASSSIPIQPGDRVKTNRRDAIQLARLMRAGELTPVYVPQVEDETIRDRRVETPRALVSSLGLTPSEYAPGERRHQGGITQAGIPHARRALIEGAWAYRSPAKVSRPPQRRLATRPKPLQEISWTARLRLGKR